jgi:hypothetical protein
MDFLVDRQDLRRCRFTDAAEEPSELAPGQQRIRIEKFAFTANNVTYGAVGEMIGYWKFFPAEAGWGRIPVWGIGVVEGAPASSTGAAPGEALREGERIYGYYPMSTHLVVEPAKLTERGFVDATPHRRDLPPVYNQYTRIENEPGYARRDEDRLMLLRPLFGTGFLLDDFLADAGFFGAEAVVIASASSKTAFSLAYLLGRNRRGREVIGLTSARNLEFVRGLGCYDRAVAYGEVGSLPAERPVVFVDMAGDRQVTGDVHRRFGNGVKYSCVVGLTHWEQSGGPEDLPGAKPEFFFAPSRIEQRTRDWGAGGLQTRLAASWRDFLDGTEGWLRVAHGRGREAVERAYRETLEGRVKPDEGLILSL